MVENANAGKNQENDFSKGSIIKNSLKLALPMAIAQRLNVLYNIVDRIYIGMIPENATLFLTGLGLCLPNYFHCYCLCQSFQYGECPMLYLLGVSNSAIDYAGAYITIYIPENYYCDSTDYYTARCIWPGHNGNTDGRTCIQLYGRFRLFWNHAFHRMAGA